MAAGFDPYYKWLGIPPEEQPPHHYRLLGLRVFESDPEVIEAASDQRMAHLRTYQTGQYSSLSQKLLNEVAAAKICLLSPDKRAKYDAALMPRVPEMPSLPPPLPFAGPPPRGPAAVVAPPPAVEENGIDLAQLGLTGPANNNGTGGPDGVSAASPEKPPRHDFASSKPKLASEKKPKRMGVRPLIALLAALATLLLLTTAAAIVFKFGRFWGASATAGGEAEAKRPLGELDALEAVSPSLSAMRPLSPLCNTPLGQSLWLHMNFEAGTVLERDGFVFVRDLSGRGHHGVCRQANPVPGHVGEGLRCDAPLRLLEGAINGVPEFTVLAWVRSRRTAQESWWMEEDAGRNCLLGVGAGSILHLRAMSKSKFETLDAKPAVILLTPAEQWNFMALRKDAGNPASLSLQVNDQKTAFSNPDLLPIDTQQKNSRTSFALTPGMEIDELMIFHRALSDADIEVLRANATPERAPAADAPALVNPAPRAVLPNPNPPAGVVFRWQSVPGAIRYWLRVEAPNQPKPVVDNQELTGTARFMKPQTAIRAENCRGWTWRVRAYVNGRWGDWSETRTFDYAEK